MIYFQGINDHELWRVNPDGSGGINLGGHKAKSAPAVHGDFVYFQGTDDVLWRIRRDGSGGIHLGGAADSQGDIVVGGYQTSASPFVTDTYVYFRGTDDKLWRINPDGTGGVNLGGYKTKSTPCVAGSYVFFQGTDDKLWRINLDGTNGVHLGGNSTSAEPSVAGSHVYFRGTDNRLLRVDLDGKAGTHLGGYQTKSSPLVTENYLFFQGTDDKLWRINLDGTGGKNLGGHKTKSRPALDPDGSYLVFQGTDDQVWRTDLEGACSVKLREFQAASSPCVGPIRSSQSPLPLVDQRFLILEPGEASTYDICFQGTDDALWCIGPDATRGTHLGGHKTRSAPVVYGPYVYFQGTDNALWRIRRDGSGGVHLGGYATSASPSVTSDHVYFRGTDDKLWRINLDGTGGVNLGGHKTRSAPCVSGRYVFFRGTDDKLWRINLDGAGGLNLGGNKTSAEPSVSDNLVYFRGTDDRLLRVDVQGKGGTQLGGYKTKSTPLVTASYVFFQGTDDKLWRINLDGSGGSNLGGHKTKGTPTLDPSGNFILFQGTDDALWRTDLEGGHSVHLGGFKTHSSPAVSRLYALPLPEGQSLVLRPGQIQTYNIRIDRVGDFEATVHSYASVAVNLQLLDGAHNLLVAGTNRIAHHFSLRDLHLGLARGTSFQLIVTAPTSVSTSVKCRITAQVYATAHCPASVLQSRLDALLHDSNQQAAFGIRINYNDQKKNIVYIKISEDLLYTLDNFGFLDTFEKMRATTVDGTALKPAAKVHLDPNVWYPFTTFDGGKEIHNLETADLVIRVGAPGITDGSSPTLTVTLTLKHNPNGAITKVTQPWTNNLNPLDDVGASVEIKQATLNIVLSIVPDGEGGLTLAADASLPVFSFNIIHLPDSVKDVQGDALKAAQDGATKAFANVLPPILSTLLGGDFNFRSAQWRGDGFDLVYAPPAEEQPHGLSPYYSARGVVAPGSAPRWSSPNLEKIDHIVVLLMENRSFDHVLGYLSLTQGRADVDGLTSALIHTFAEDVRPQALAETRLPFDPDHSYRPVAVQMGNDDGDQGPMRGFVRSFIAKYPFMAFAPDSEQRKNQDDPYWFAARAQYTKNAVMRYHTAQTLPFYAHLANEYMICDRWYASHPGPTFPNRFFYLSGHLNRGPDGLPQQDNGQESLKLIRDRTIQDALTERGIPWKMYESPPDVCMLRMYARYAFDDTNIRPMQEFLEAARAGALPAVSFLEPNFHLGVGTNDDHPPSDMAAGQRLIQQIYEALTANQNSWNKTLFIITYDEHGGFHDHHLPELADRYVTPGRPIAETNYGVRVPAFIVCPWVAAGATTRSVTPEVYDHTSILKTIVNRFCPNDPAIMSDRMAFANDLFPLLTLATPRVPKRPAVVAGGTARSSTSAPPQHKLLESIKAAHATLQRNSQLFAGSVDWHQYMARLSLMLK